MIFCKLTFFGAIHGRSDEFREAVKAVSDFGAGYVPPCYNALRENFLQISKMKMDSWLDVWREEGRRSTSFVLSSDGYEDNSNNALINIVLSTRKGAHFVKAINTAGAFVFRSSYFIDAEY